MFTATIMAACPSGHFFDCKCPLDNVWSNGTLTVYSKSKLMAYGRLMFIIPKQADKLFAKHRLQITTLFSLGVCTEDYGHGPGPVDRHLVFMMQCNTGETVGMYCYIDRAGVGLSKVRAIQRWWRRLIATKKQQRALAMAMALHGRLGVASALGALGKDLVAMCV